MSGRLVKYEPSGSARKVRPARGRRKVLEVYIGIRRRMATQRHSDNG